MKRTGAVPTQARRASKSESHRKTTCRHRAATLTWLDVYVVAGAKRTVAYDRLPVNQNGLLHDEQAPLAGNSLQGVQAMIAEFDAGARDEILDRTGNHP
jgi:hypothetical protein